MYSVQMVSTASYSFSFAFLIISPTMWRVGRMYTPRTGKGVRSLQLPRSSPWANQLSCPLHDFLQHSPSWLAHTILHAPFFSNVPWTVSKGGAWRWLIWQLYSCTEGTYHRDNISKCKGTHTHTHTHKIMVLNFFFFPTKSPVIQTSDLSNPPEWKLDHTECYLYSHVI